ncbi:LysR family transcriptional regulator (plasmid) [Pantoea sp. C3]|uniref:LysR family transcriptional regulator n=1 Tax=Pantoea phytostimulans TaxID=2769024 RepID=UPI0038F7D55A
MELRHIRYFLMVAEEKNFTRAAARLGIGQPPLSMQIRDLERELKVSLFIRSSQSTQLTEAGKAFYDAVKPMTAIAEEAVKAAQRAGRGEIGLLHLGFTGTAGVNPLIPVTIRAFKRTFPEVELKVTEANSIALIDALIAKKLDVALLRPTASVPAGICVSDLRDEKLVVALPSSHPLARQRGKIDLSLLKYDPFILTPGDAGVSLREASIQACRQAGFDVIEGQKAPHIVSILSVVAAELGVSLVPESLTQFNLTGVSFRQVKMPVPTIGLAAAWNENNKNSVIENFLTEARSHIRDNR